MSQTNFLASFGPRVSERNFHQGSIILPILGLSDGKPSVAPVGVRRNSNFHIFQSLGLNHPKVWVGCALISLIITHGISTIKPSTLIAPFISWFATELEFTIRARMDLKDAERPFRFGGMTFFWYDGRAWRRIRCSSASKVFFALN